MRLSSRLDDKGFPKLSDRIDRIASYEPPPEFEPRTIREEDLPPDASVMYHATTDLQNLQNMGLVSRKEMRDWGWPEAYGIGGGSDKTITLTRRRQVAEDILRAMINMKKIIGIDDPRRAIETAEDIIREDCLKYDVPFDEIISEARSVLQGGWIALENGIIHKHGTMRREELPPGAIPKEMSGDIVTYWWEPMTSKDQWAGLVAEYFNQLLDAMGRRGGPVAPLFWDFDPQRYEGFDPETAGVAEVMVSGPPERWDEEYHPDWAKSPMSGLAEWSGDPNLTRVIKRR